MKRSEVIGYGKNRIVYDISSGYCLKMVRSGSKRKSNKTEVMLYKSSPYLIKKHLGRILVYHQSYDWLIMKKYSRKFPKTKRYKRELFKLLRKFKAYGIYPIDSLKRGRPHYKNLRLRRNGTIVVIDYGHFKIRGQ